MREDLVIIRAIAETVAAELEDLCIDVKIAGGTFFNSERVNFEIRVKDQLINFSEDWIIRMRQEEWKKIFFWHQYTDGIGETVGANHMYTHSNGQNVFGKNIAYTIPARDLAHESAFIPFVTFVTMAAEDRGPTWERWQKEGNWSKMTDDGELNKRRRKISKFMYPHLYPGTNL
jgi:hypothetical protein